MAQLAHHLGRVRIGERVLLPRLEIPVDERFRGLYPGPGEELPEGRAPLLEVRDLPEVNFCRTEHRSRLGHAILVTMRAADRAPEFVMVDGVPGRERAAPVEYHRRYCHAC
jgi:hypothetical protein